MTANFQIVSKKTARTTLFYGIWVVLLAIPILAAYKPAGQLVTDFAAFFGKDAQNQQRYGRLAYYVCLGLDNKWDNGYTRIWAMDARDGIPRRIPFGFNDTNSCFMFPNITKDGQRIVYTNFRSSKICVVNWDGMHGREVIAGWIGSRIWRAPDGSDWVIATSANQMNIGTTGHKAIYRINIDNPSEKVLLWDKTEVDSKKWGFWASLSDDGKMMGATFPWNFPGVASVPNGTLKLFNVSNGCSPTIQKDNSYNLLHIFNDHGYITFLNYATGARTDYRTPAGTGCGCVTNDVRWSNDPDIVTSEMQGAFSPVVQRLSDATRYVSLTTDTAPRALNCDLLIYSGDYLNARRASVIVNPLDRGIDLNSPVDISVETMGNPGSEITQMGVGGIGGGKTGFVQIMCQAYDGALYGRDTVTVTFIDTVPFKIQHPAAGEKIQIGSTYAVSWQIDEPQGLVPEISLDNGATWSDFNATVCTDGCVSWQWKVDSANGQALTPSIQCLFQLHEYSPTPVLIAKSGRFSLVNGPVATRKDAPSHADLVPSMTAAHGRIVLAKPDGAENVEVILSDIQGRRIGSYRYDAGQRGTIALPMTASCGMVLYAIVYGSHADCGMLLAK